MRYRNLSGAILTSTLALAMSSAAVAQSSARTALSGTNTQISSSIGNVGDLSVFTPRAQSKNTRIDYTLWDEALSNVVLDLGPSSRMRARLPVAEVGTRMVRGHKSAYRLEGTRVTFAYINDTYKSGLTEYRKDLESVANQIDIPSLSRDEQLAFWLNLHNVGVIEQIAIAYPVDRPERIKINIDGEKQRLDEAKFITIRGQKISLSDIREKIVYPNWSDASVIYGFFRGNIGSPGLPRQAYTASDLDYLLNANADEFVNALRGFNEGSGSRNVSAIYEEAQPFFFKNWERDLEAHLLKYANDDVAKEVQSDKPFKVDRFDDMIADLSGGRRLGSSGNPRKGATTMSFETARLLSEVREKQRYLRNNDMINEQRGWVIIEDLEPSDTTLSPPTIEQSPEP